jgi:hypothetical protein
MQPRCVAGMQRYTGDGARQERAVAPPAQRPGRNRKQTGHTSQQSSESDTTMKNRQAFSDVQLRTNVQPIVFTAYEQSR